jgi:hypothetical protein
VEKQKRIILHVCIFTCTDFQGILKNQFIGFFSRTTGIDKILNKHVSPLTMQIQVYIKIITQRMGEPLRVMHI